MKKVLAVDIGERKGGIENLIFNLYSGIDHNEIQMDFLIYHPHCAYEDYFKENRSMIYQIKSRKKNPFLYSLQLKRFFVEHQEYDFIWIQTCSASNITAHKMAKKYTTSKIITHAHVSKAETRSKIHGLFTSVCHKVNQKKLQDMTDIPLCCSKEAGLYLFGKNGDRPVTVIKNGIPIKKYRHSSAEKLKLRERLGIGEECVVGHVGRFSKVKNHTFIIRVFELLCEMKKECRLVLIGDGEERDTIEKMVTDKNLQSKVMFLGEQDDVAQLLAVMDVFIFPSVYEGFGIAVIEAQASGIPCIINETLPDTLDVTGFVHRKPLAGQEEDWAKAIFDLSVRKTKICEADIEKQLRYFDISLSVDTMNRIFQGG